MYYKLVSSLEDFFSCFLLKIVVLTLKFRSIIYYELILYNM